MIMLKDALVRLRRERAFTYETTMDEMIEDCAPRMAEAMGWTVDEVASLLGAVLPTLRRWA